MYLLDTNIVSEPLKKAPNLDFLRKLKSHSLEELYITSITVMELRYGALRKKDGGKLWKKIEQEVVNCYNILDFGGQEAFCAGDILANLSETGILIGVEDVMIAAVSLLHNLVLVTGNEKHFRRIPFLKVENWLS